MTRILAVLAAMLIPGLTALAHADERLSRAEVAEIEALLDEWGCVGYDEIEKDDGLYEIDDAKCAGREVDIKLNADFAVVSAKRD